MSTQTINVATDTTSTIKIGYEDESAVTQVIFNLSSWVSEYGEGTCTLWVRRNTDTEGYPATVTFENGYATWTVSESDTSVPGWGEAQIAYTVDDVKKRSAVYGVFTEKSIESGASTPSAYAAWAESLNTQMQTLATSVSNMLAMLATEYSEDETYSFGDVVMYDGSLYFNSNRSGTITGEWDSSLWTEITVAYMLWTLVNLAITQEDSIATFSSNFTASLAQEFLEESAYAVGDYVVYDGRLYKCIIAKEAGGTFENFRFEATTVMDEIVALTQ